MLKRVFRPKRDEGRDCIMSGFMMWTAHRMLFEWSKQEEWDGRGMWHGWRRGEVRCIQVFGGCVIVSEVRSVCSTINMPRKCVNSSDPFCYICGEVTFKSRRRSFTPLIKNCYEHYFGCKVGDQDKSWAPHFCCVTCQASRGMGKRFTMYAFRHSYGLERAHRPCFRLLLLPDQYHWCNSKVQTHCSVS